MNYITKFFNFAVAQKVVGSRLGFQKLEFLFFKIKIVQF